MKVAIAGGGTGGHLFPGIAVADALGELDSESEVLFVGTERGIEARKVPAAGYELATITIGGLKGVSAKRLVQTLWQLPQSILEARKILRDFGAEAVLGVGGYASGPVLLAARSLGLPTAICEQNSVPGITNRTLGKLVGRVYASFPSSASYFAASRFRLVGNPVRVDFRNPPQKEMKPEQILVFGGSQGARALNEKLPEALGLIQSSFSELRVIHQAGRDEVETIEKRYADAAVAAEILPFIDDMVTAYLESAIVVCRAGATSCAEIAALGVCAVLIPFPFATDDHQTKNAMDLVDADAAIILPQDDASPEKLADILGGLLGDAARRDELARNARAHGKPEAALTVAKACLQKFEEA